MATARTAPTPSTIEPTQVAIYPQVGLAHRVGSFMRFSVFLCFFFFSPYEIICVGLMCFLEFVWNRASCEGNCSILSVELLLRQR